MDITTACTREMSCSMPSISPLLDAIADELLEQLSKLEWPLPDHVLQLVANSLVSDTIRHISRPASCGPPRLQGGGCAPPIRLPVPTPPHVVLTPGGPAEWGPTEKPHMQPPFFSAAAKLSRYEEVVRLVVAKHARRRERPVTCVFCKKNGEAPEFYMKHNLKDGNGNVVCPVLRNYRCPICGASGHKAHTIKYCPAAQVSLR